MGDYRKGFRYFRNKMACVVCGRETPVSDLRSLRNVFLPVCSTVCVYSFINQMHLGDNEISKEIDLAPYESDGMFKSPFEEMTYRMLSKKFEVLYEPYRLMLPELGDHNSSKYVPDFFLPEKNLFIEVKGKTTLGYAKIVKFSKYITLYVITPEMCRAWGWMSV